MMLKTINLFRFNLQCCGKCRGLVNRVSTSAVLRKTEKDFLNEKLKFLEGERKVYQDTFGDIESFEFKFDKIQDDPEDIADYERRKQAKGKTLVEYKKEISELLTKHQYKEAKRVLEVDMVNDKVKVDIGVYRMLFNYNALKGDAEEAYKLYVGYRKRQGRMTGPMYTSLFNACANCQNSSLALSKAEIIRENLANDKLHKVNIFNYNSMLKAFGRHGDIPTCLKIFDEVLEKRLQAFTYTYNFLLQSCISDRNSGLRHALLVWRKMLQNRRKPDIYFFNLFLRCIRDCSLGDVELIPDLIDQINKESGKFFKKKVITKKVQGELQRKIITVPTSGTDYLKFIGETASEHKEKNEVSGSGEIKAIQLDESKQSDAEELQGSEVTVKEISQLELVTDGVKNECLELELSENEELGGSCESEENTPILESVKLERVEKSNYELPDLMAFEPSVGSVINFGALTKPHHRIMLFGGVTGFLKTMEKFDVRPNVRTLSLLLCVSPPTAEAEQKILELAKSYEIELDAPFFSQFIKKRIFSGRSDLLKDCLSEMQKANVQPDLICFGVLAFGCKTLEMGSELLETLKLYGYRPNNEILYGLLHSATYVRDFAYVKAILDAAKANGVELNSKFVAKLGRFVRSEAYERREPKDSQIASET